MLLAGPGPLAARAVREPAVAPRVVVGGIAFAAHPVLVMLGAGGLVGRRRTAVGARAHLAHDAASAGSLAQLEQV